ncbi:IS3 family transposase [Rhodococcoides kroppenstedtii]|uniref:IS3 family transposase n=1 Tax=Rhodococcoides kroppenstedtii TaxID=293050 RepID=UPI003638298E
MPRVADQLGVHPEALRNWVRQAEIDGGVRPGPTTDDAQRLAELEREVRELRRANEILKTSAAFFRGRGTRPQDQVEVPTAVLVDYIDQHRGRFGVEPICAVLKDAGVQIAPSTYYAAKAKPPSARAVRDAELVVDIQAAHKVNLGVYGARKIHAELNRKGVKVARCTIKRGDPRRGPARNSAGEDWQDHDR